MGVTKEFLKKYAKEADISEARARQVLDGDIDLPTALHEHDQQLLTLGEHPTDAIMSDAGVIAKTQANETQLFQWKQELPDEQRRAVTNAEIAYKKGNPAPLAKLYKTLGATALASGGALASEDAEAAKLRLLGGMAPETATRQIKNRLNKDRQKGISPSRSTTDYIHNNTNYDNGFLSSIKKSGEEYGGPTYTGGVKEFAYELLQSTDDPQVRSAVMEWVQPRIARGGQVAAVTAAAGGANRAAANDGKPKEQGMIANILDKMEQLELIPDERTRIIGMELLKREVGNALATMERPAQGLWGTLRGAFGAATGEKAHDTRRAMKEVYTQPTDRSLDRAGQYVLRETGSPAAAAAVRTGGMLADPSNWLL